MALIDLITKEIVCIPMQSTNKYDVMRELTTQLKQAGKIENIDPVIEALMERERKGSTGLEMGIAVPHCKTSHVDQLLLAIGVAPQGIDFQALDGEPSKLFFLLLAPPDQSGPHIEALAEIAKLASSTSFCAAMIDSTSAEEIVELFTE